MSTTKGEKSDNRIWKMLEIRRITQNFDWLRVQYGLIEDVEGDNSTTLFSERSSTNQVTLDLGDGLEIEVRLKMKTEEFFLLMFNIKCSNQKA